MQCYTRPRITELNPHLLCVLCGGYYIDATAIIECLHSFCRSCIVRYLETHKYCPICDVLVHKNKPLQNIMPDTILQNIVYKLVPNLYEREMRNRRQFYLKVHPSLHPSCREEKGEITEYSKFYSTSDTINFSLEYRNHSDSFMETANKRFFRCQSPVTIECLRKLIAAKYGLQKNYEVRFFYEEIQLPEYLSLLDIAYIASWRRRGFIRILYQVLEIRRIVMKIEPQPALITAVTIPPPEISKIDLPIDTPCITGSEDAEGKLTEKKVALAPVQSTVSITCTTDTSNVSKIDTEPPISALVTTSRTSITVTSNIETAQLTVVTSSVPTITSIFATVNGISKCSKLSEVSALSIENVSNQYTLSHKERMPSQAIPFTMKSDKNNTANPAKTKDVETKKVDKRKPVADVKRKIESFSSAEVNKETMGTVNIKARPPVPIKIPKLAVKLASVTNNGTHRSIDNIPALKPIKMTSIVTSTSCPSITVTSVSVSTNSDQKIATVATTTYISNYDYVQKCAPRPIFTRSELPGISKLKTTVVKSITRPWSTPSATTTVHPMPRIDTSEKPRPMKIIEPRNTPRFLGNPVSGIRAMYHVTPPEAHANNKVPKREDMKKEGKVALTRIDPRTLSPIAATSANSMMPTSSKNTFSRLPTSSELYASCTAFSPSPLPTVTNSSTSSSAKQSPFMLNNLPYNSLYPMNQLIMGMYDNAGALGCMKAMASNFHPSFFHPSMHPHLTSLCGGGSSSKITKLEKTPKLSPSHIATNNKTPPPAIQRIPPSNNNTKLSVCEHSSEDEKSSKHDCISNGQVKSRNHKKSPEVNNFLINNLIPLETLKKKKISHSCTADGVNQLCDQLSPKSKKNSHENVKEVRKTTSDIDGGRKD